MTRSSSDVAAQLRLIEVKPGKKFPLATLKAMLPDAETALFFGKVYDLQYMEMSNLLATVLGSNVADALFRSGDNHSHDLQDYLVDLQAQGAAYNLEAGEILTTNEPTHAEVLPHVWEAMEVEVADSIKAVVDKLDTVMKMMPGKQGAMVFQNLAVLNKKRPVIGDFRARIVHPPAPDNLVVFDVSGSMSSDTVKSIVTDVVALGYKANAHLAIVSDTTTHWEPGTYNVEAVLRAAEYGGTHYETLAPLFNQDWGTVVTIADYDSSRSAQEHIKKCTGSIQENLDISLVNTPTFLSACVGQLAAKVRPILVCNSSRVLRD